MFINLDRTWTKNSGPSWILQLIQKHEIKQQIRTTNYLDWENQEHDFQNEEVSPKIFPQKTKGSHKEQDDLVWRKDPVRGGEILGIRAELRLMLGDS